MGLDAAWAGYSPSASESATGAPISIRFHCVLLVRPGLIARMDDHTTHHDLIVKCVSEFISELIELIHPLQRGTIDNDPEAQLWSESTLVPFHRHFDSAEVQQTRKFVTI
jgi:hypothetical protein